MVAQLAKNSVLTESLQAFRMPSTTPSNVRTVMTLKLPWQCAWVMRRADGWKPRMSSTTLTIRIQLMTCFIRYPVDSFKDPKNELEPKSEMPPWFIVFYEQYVRQRDEMLNMIQRSMPALPSYGHPPPQENALQQKSYFEDDVEQQVDPM